MLDNKYNIDFLQKEVSNARKNDYFSRIENFYKKLPKTECNQCGRCCFAPPACSFVEFMYAYELYETLDYITKIEIIKRVLRRFFYAVLDKFAYPCGLLNDDKTCLLYSRACLSCKQWGISGRKQYDEQWADDIEYNRQYQKFYKRKYGIEITDTNINDRLEVCEEVRIIKNPYNLQDVDYDKYLQSLVNPEIKCLQHAGIEEKEQWSFNEWFAYFTFGKSIFDTRIKLVLKLQQGETNAVDLYIDSIEYDQYI